MAVRGAIWIAVLGLLALTWLAPATRAAVPENRYAIAVIVGNKAYDCRVPDVDFAHNDAEAMKRFVIEVLGYRDGNIIDLRDVTKGRLEAVFGIDTTHKGQLFDRVRPGTSDVLVFYSAHGVPGSRGCGASGSICCLWTANPICRKSLLSSQPALRQPCEDPCTIGDSVSGHVEKQPLLRNGNTVYFFLVFS